MMVIYAAVHRHQIVMLLFFLSFNLDPLLLACVRACVPVVCCRFISPGKNKGVVVIVVVFQSTGPLYYYLPQAGCSIV